MIVLSIVAAVAAAQSAPKLKAPVPPGAFADVIKCQLVTAPADRLACYDASVQKLSSAADKREIVIVDQAEVRKTRRSLFGFAVPDIPFFGGKSDGEPDESRQFETKISYARAGRAGLWIMALIDGGTWQFAEPSRSVEPEAGDPILIKRTAFGGYMASIAGQRAVRVQRIR